MKRQKPTTFSSEMYQKALQQIHDLKWQLSLREAAWAAAEEVDRQKSERIRELESALRMVLDDPDSLSGRPRTLEVVMEALEQT